MLPAHHPLRLLPRGWLAALPGQNLVIGLALPVLFAGVGLGMRRIHQPLHHADS